MSKITLNIAKEYENGLIAEIDKEKYFQLHKNATTRADLYAFAIACAIMEKKDPAAPQNVDSLVRVEYLGDYDALLSCLFFDMKLKNDTDQIDTICERDDVYLLAEKYANAGFEVLQNWHNSFDEETLFYKLIGYMDTQFNQIQDEVRQILL